MDRQAAGLRILGTSEGLNPPKLTVDRSILEELTQKSGIRQRFLNRTFERFTVTPENEPAYRAALWYADHFQQMLPYWEDGALREPEKNRNGLFFIGDCGVGKTHLAAAIANRLLKQGQGVVCMTMIDLLARLKETFRDGPKGHYGPTEAEIMKNYAEVPLLIIDDLGSEQPTEWGISKIYAIINVRYEAYMPIIVTTNYAGGELAERMTPGARASDRRNAQKTIDRLREVCGAVEMRGISWRTK